MLIGSDDRVTSETVSMRQFVIKAICVVGEEIKDPVHELLVLIAAASSEGLDEPVHMHSLVRAFAARMHIEWKKFLTSSSTGKLRMRV